MRAARTLLILFAGMLLFVLPAVAGNPNPFESNASFPITLNLAYTWDGSSTGYADWFLHQDRTFHDSQGTYGKWNWNSSTNTLTIQYVVGCYPTYVGTMTSTGHFDGEMNCRAGSGHGTWSADLASGAPSPPNPAGAPLVSSPR